MIDWFLGDDFWVLFCPVLSTVLQCGARLQIRLVQLDRAVSCANFYLGVCLSVHCRFLAVLCILCLVIGIPDFFIFVPALVLSKFTLFCFRFSSVSLSYLILAAPMHPCWRNCKNLWNLTADKLKFKHCLFDWWPFETLSESVDLCCTSEYCTTLNIELSLPLSELIWIKISLKVLTINLPFCYLLVHRMRVSSKGDGYCGSVYCNGTCRSRLLQQCRRRRRKRDPSRWSLSCSLYIWFRAIVWFNECWYVNAYLLKQQPINLIIFPVANAWYQAL